MKSRQLHTQNWDQNDKIDKVSSIIQYELPRNTSNIFNFLHDPWSKAKLPRLFC
jgi:hypothetical protein